VKYHTADGEELKGNEVRRADHFKAAMERRSWWEPTNGTNYDLFVAPSCKTAGYGDASSILNASTKDFILVNRFHSTSVKKTIKDKIPVSETLNKYSEERGERPSWWPETFPCRNSEEFEQQLPELQAAFSRYAAKEEDNNERNTLQGKMWIVKGKQHGAQQIDLFDDYQELEDRMKEMIVEEELLAQKYIEKPLLVDGSKFDLRMYVLVSSDRKVHLYREGEVKVCATQYSLGSTEKNVHITNNKIQKLEKNYDNTQHMLSTDDLEGRVARADFHWHTAFGKIKEVAREYFLDVMVDTLIEREPTKGSFYLFGMDVIFDEDLNVYLLEVNHCPGLCNRYCSEYLGILYNKMHEDIVRTVVDPLFPPPEGILAFWPHALSENGFVPVTAPQQSNDVMSKAKSFFQSLFHTEL